MSFGPEPMLTLLGKQSMEKFVQVAYDFFNPENLKETYEATGKTLVDGVDPEPHSLQDFITYIEVSNVLPANPSTSNVIQLIILMESSGLLARVDQTVSGVGLSDQFESVPSHSLS
ncbi:MAG: hypothetical protein F4X44_12405 [Gammaproteobacteria bacterium]|nr:hypothetical protein [Gammaproteobacteria bacterium]